MMRFCRCRAANGHFGDIQFVGKLRNLYGITLGNDLKDLFLPFFCKHSVPPQITKQSE